MNFTSSSNDLVHAARSLLLRGGVFAAFISIFLNIVTFVGPIFMIQVYERVIPARSHETLYGLVIIGFGGVVLFGLLDFIRSYTCQIIAQGLARKLNLPALQAGLLRSVEGGVNEGGQVIRDISDLRAFLSGNAVTTPLDALCALFFIGGLYYVHPVYGHVALAFILFMLTLNVVTDRLTRGAIRQANEATNRHAADVAGSLRHAEVIEAMGMMPALVRNWRSTQIEMLTMSATASIRAKAVLAISKATQKCLQMVTVTTGAILVLAHEINPGVLFAGMVLTSQAVMPFSHMIESWRSYVSAAQAWGRISALVRRQPAMRQTMPALTGNGSLVVENLAYLPPGRDLPVLRGLSFTVHPGEILGIAGPSGAGKSTLARALVGVIRPDVGGVYLDGHSTFLWERGSFGRAVGYLPQSLSLIDGTVRQTIARMEASDPREVIRAAQAADIHDFIGRLPHGYDTPVAEGAHLLSGGQLQRLALARALYGSPKLLILDEPNSNLDQVGEQALIRAIGAARARGAIVIIIAHRPSVMSTADKILILENGSISQYGPRNDVIDLASGNGKLSATGTNIRILGTAGDGR